MTPDTLTAIRPNCRLEVTPDDMSLTPEQHLTVERIWKDETAANPKLFNGRQLSVVQITPEAIRCRAVEYRFILSHLRQPGAIPGLVLHPLALTVVLEAGGSVIFGKRSQEVSQMPGYWEPAPSGGVEFTATGQAPAGIRDQALRELREELGLRPEHIASLVPLAVFQDPVSRVADICVHARANISAQTLLTLFNELSGWEYETVAAVPLARLPEFTAQHQGRLVAPTLPFLRKCKLM